VGSPNFDNLTLVPLTVAGLLFWRCIIDGSLCVAAA